MILSFAPRLFLIVINGMILSFLKYKNIIYSCLNLLYICLVDSFMNIVISHKVIRAANNGT